VFRSVDALWEQYRSVSPYNYCGNNPLMFRDPTGMGWFNDVVKGVNDIAHGAFDATLSDVTGRDIRTGDQHSPMYRAAKLGGHVADAVIGVGLTLSGAGEISGGVALAPATGGASLVVSAKGVLTVAGGIWVSGNAIQNTGQMLSQMSQSSGSQEKREREIWQPTYENSEKVAEHRRFGKFYKHSDGTWWSKDLDGHGGSAWKVFKEKNGKLEWFKDADKYGDYIEGKHKSDVGKVINMKELKILK
jgi:hypothetical protein